ncbi:hypothetical protein PMKS-002827 [Pichia membranifaciens]|uniref:UBA domain-containing protein n=1 Tax=Pichia membranifaciens TaxID=4926 RepID=A0A1Q2YIK2_9ASCO|nr:hypothetical protein PMKS-002827 [Pichia membranifaciens]
MSGDIFADLLKASGSGAGSASNNDSNLSLKQRMDGTRGTPRTQQSGGLDLDFLDTYVSKKPAASRTASPAVDDLLFAHPARASSSGSASVSGNVQQNSTGSSSNRGGSSSNTGTDLLDDFFGQPLPNPTPAASVTAVADQHPPAANLARPSSQERRDGVLAELVDMGFPLEKANAALDSTASGSDLDGAISYLMEQAHSQTATRQQRPAPDMGGGRRASRWESSTLAPTDNNSTFEMYKSSSRHRPSRTNTITSSSPTAPKPSATEIPSLIETSTTPAPGLAPAAATTSIFKFNIPPLDSAQTLSFTTSREIGQEKFKAGDYTASLENYLSASSVIPAEHPYQIIISSNLSVVYSKLGNPKEQLAISSRGLKLLSQATGDLPLSELSHINIEDNKNLRNFWVKLMTKRAESLEFLERWADAKDDYEKLIKEGESSKAVMDGKNRCAKILNPQAPPKPKAKPRAPVAPTQRKKATAYAQNGENLKHVKENNLKKEKEEEEKFGLHDKVESQLDRWRSGNKSNIRALICSLDTILWPELNWQPVKLTDLVLDKKVKIYYMKAVAKTHPDKISNSETVENKMIANGVFITLNEAWETFKESKGM